MGYYTSYTLSANDGEAFTEQVQKALEDLNVFEDINTCTATAYCKWYDATEDMKEFSKKFPTTVFALHGEGEETGDIWDEYYLNGKHQHCHAEIVIPPYDLTKLED